LSIGDNSFINLYISSRIEHITELIFDTDLRILDNFHFQKSDPSIKIQFIPGLSFSPENCLETASYNSSSTTGSNSSVITSYCSSFCSKILIPWVYRLLFVLYHIPHLISIFSQSGIAARKEFQAITFIVSAFAVARAEPSAVTFAFAAAVTGTTFTSIKFPL